MTPPFFAQDGKKQQLLSSALDCSKQNLRPLKIAGNYILI